MRQLGNRWRCFLKDTARISAARSGLSCMDDYQLTVFGDPIAHSYSPQIHSVFAKQWQHATPGKQKTVNYTRTRASRADFPALLETFRVQGGVGANVTLPLKEIAWDLVTSKSHEAELAGAVNTLIRTDAGWHGENTDGTGLYTDLCDLDVEIKGADILMVGAGGAVRGVLPALLGAQPRSLTITNRNLERAIELTTLWQDVKVNPNHIQIEAIGFEELAHKQRPYSLLINATSSGLQGERPAIPSVVLAEKPFCYDMLYGAAAHPFLKWALEHDCRVADGFGMLVAQAARSFQLWTGFYPDYKAAHDTLRSFLAEKTR